MKYLNSDLSNSTYNFVIYSIRFFYNKFKLGPTNHYWHTFNIIHNEKKSLGHHVQAACKFKFNHVKLVVAWKALSNQMKWKNIFVSGNHYWIFLRWFTQSNIDYYRSWCICYFKKLSSFFIKRFHSPAKNMKWFMWESLAI